MSIKHIFAASISAGSMALAGVASAATLVTLNPQANNGGAGVVDAGTPAFQAVGFQSNLTSSLVINGVSGVQGFNETGQIRVTSFQNLSGAVMSNVNSTYGIFANFTLSGVGQYNPSNVFTANPGSLTFSINLFADPGNDGVGPNITLGSATLTADPTNFAFAILSGTPVPNGSGSANTTLSARLNFTPAAGTAGAGGFFQQPVPFLIDLAIGNAGGNSLNTTYSVNGSGVVTVSTTGVGANPGTANATFASRVPEPSALALVGIALFGVGVASRRKKPAVV